MPVKEVLLLRHGHRLAWTLDPTNGRYSSTHPFPTQLPADPPLASHGVRQAEETGRYLGETLLEVARQGRLRIYSSLFYRCLETLRPTVEILRSSLNSASYSRDDLLHKLEVRGERGIGEWFGHAWFEQPAPALPSNLRKEFFPWINETYVSKIIPDSHGERIDTLHDRVAKALEHILKDVDDEFAQAGRQDEEITLLLCGHAAQIICSGRALTGEVPKDYDEDDFQCFTCGISKFVRRDSPPDEETTVNDNWRHNGGVAGGWDCVANSDCTHLSQGPERGWHFQGDESFDSYGAGTPRTSDGVNDPLRKRLNAGNEQASKL